MAKKKIVRAKPKSAAKESKPAKKKPAKKTTKKTTTKKPAAKKPASKKPASKKSVPAKQALAVSVLQQPEFADMPTAWLKSATTAMQLHQETAEVAVLSQHKLGQIVADMLDDPDTYGSRSVPLLSKALALSPNTLYAARAFAQEYDYQEVVDIVEKARTSGHLLTAGHFAQLCRVVGPRANQVRERLTKIAVNQKLSVRGLCVEIERHISKGSSGRGGSLPARPRSLYDGISQVAKTSQSYLSRFPGWEEVVIAGLEDQEEEIDEQSMEKLIEARNTQQALIDQATKLRDACSRAIVAAGGEDGEETVDADGHSEPVVMDAEIDDEEVDDEDEYVYSDEEEEDDEDAEEEEDDDEEIDHGFDVDDLFEDEEDDPDDED